MGKKRNKKAQELGMEAAMELPTAGISTDGGVIHSDVLGSYTGLALRGEPFEPLEMVYLDSEEIPVQDADDL